VGKKNRQATAPVQRTRDTPGYDSIKVRGTDGRFAQAVFAAANKYLGRRCNIPMAEFLQAIEDAEWAWRRGTKSGGPEQTCAS